MAHSWTKAIVEHRLIEAQRVIAKVVQRPGVRISRRATDIPEPSHHYGLHEILQFERDRFAHYKQEGYYDPRNGDLIRPIIQGTDSIPPEQAAIARAFEAWRWPAQYVSDERRRVAVQCFVVFRTNRRHGFTQAVNSRLKRIWLGDVSRTQCYRLKDEGIATIVDALRAAGVPVELMEAA